MWTSPLAIRIDSWHKPFISSDQMLRDLLHMDFIKNSVEGVLNTWLTYVMSQPVNFDLAVIIFFILQYTGIVYIKNTYDKMKVFLK